MAKINIDAKTKADTKNVCNALCMTVYNPTPLTEAAA